MNLTPDQKLQVRRYSAGEATAIEVRRALGDVTFGVLFQALAEEGLRLPPSPTAGREADIARAREWMFPKA